MDGPCGYLIGLGGCSCCRATEFTGSHDLRLQCCLFSRCYVSPNPAALSQERAAGGLATAILTAVSRKAAIGSGIIARWLDFPGDSGTLRAKTLRGRKKVQLQYTPKPSRILNSCLPSLILTLTRLSYSSSTTPPPLSRFPTSRHNRVIFARFSVRPFAHFESPSATRVPVSFCRYGKESERARPNESAFAPTLPCPRQ